ncbi:DUF2142 domain-containing protein [Herbiconiux liukaitaii]|uniref:DUF2142 domain-containing protein n=1 Tax=Herbiconiux liukaitaii TaxID=3342799 RepID=UPI0035B89AC6
MTYVPSPSALRAQLAAPHRSAGRHFLLPWLLLALLGSLWAVATPIGGSPDEPAHVVKAASVVRGELLPSEMIATGGVLHVPAAYAAEYAQGCFAFFAEIPASCAPGFTGDPSEIVETYSSASLYNPVYYVLVGWPSLVLPDTIGIYAMRIMSAVLTSLFLAAAFWVVAAWRLPRVPSLGILIGTTPIVLYLMGTVNPNALEFTGGLALFAAMLGIVLDPQPRLLGSRLALVVVASALVSNTRGISPLWVALLLALPLLLLTGRELGALLKKPGVIISILLIGITAAFSAWWTLSSNSLGTGPSTGPEIVQTNPGVGLTPLEGFIGELGNTYLRLRQMVGILGWLDTPLSPPLYYIAYALFGLLVLGVIVFVRGRKLVFLAVLALAFFFLPAFIQSFYVTKGGYIWQGRYTLVLMMALLLGMAACIAASDRFVRWQQRLDEHGVARRGARGTVTVLAWLAGIAWAFIVSWAFLTTMRRMTVGYSVDWLQMFEPGAWEPPLGALPLMIAFAVVALGLGVTVAAGFRDPRPEPVLEDWPADDRYPSSQPEGYAASPRI